MSLDLTAGTVCVTDGRTVEIDGPDTLGKLRVRDMGTGEMLSVPIAKIHPLEEKPPVSTSGTGLISAPEWKRARDLCKDLAPLNKRAKVPGPELTKIAKRHGISLRQLQRLRAEYQKDPSVTSLARSKGGRPEGLNCLAPEVDALIKHTIEKHYCRREKPPKSEIVERARSVARRLKLKPPSRAAVLRRLHEADTWQTHVTRVGSKAAGQRWEPRTGGLRVDKPLDLIQIDHTPADVLVLSDDRLRILGRPWVTVAIDVASRCVVGLYVSMDAPSSVSVSLCIEHLVLPKPENAKDPNLWPMYGKPRKILVDNGKDFRSQALARGCEQHDIDLAWRPVRTPHYGAHIERLIGTLMKIAHLLPGTTFSNIREKGDYDSEGRARLTLSEFREWLTVKICRYYHVRRHRALGVPPVVAWERGLTKEGVFVAPSLMERPLEFRMHFLPTTTRKVRRTGIEFNNSRYWHDDLGRLLGRREEVEVRYDPRDPSQIWIQDRGQLITAEAIAGPAVGQRIDRMAIDAARAAELDEQIDAGFEATDGIESNADKATKSARRKAGIKRPQPSPKPSAKTSEASTPQTDPPIESEYTPPMAPTNRTPIQPELWN